MRRLHFLSAYTAVFGGILSRPSKLEIDLALDDRKIDLVEEGVDVALRKGDLADSLMTVRLIGQSARHVVGTKENLQGLGAQDTC